MPSLSNPVKAVFFDLGWTLVYPPSGDWEFTEPAKKLYLLDKKDVFRGMGLWALRLQFTTENPGEIDKILMDYQGRAAFDAGSYTRGLYSRGVE